MPSPAGPRQPPTPARGGDSPSNPVGAWSEREAALVSRIRQRGIADREAWNELLAHHQDRLYATCLRMVGPNAAADLTQDAMVKILQGLDGYDGRSQLSTWMIRVAMNACLSWLRSQKLRRHKSLDVGSPFVRGLGTSPNQPELSAGQGVERKEAKAALAAALAELPDEQRAILVLRDVHGLEYEQVAGVLEIAVGTVKSRLFRARLALRAGVEDRLRIALPEAGRPATPTAET